MLRRLIDGFGIIKKVIKREKGYTLVEVAAVVAITSTLAAVVIPVVIDKIEQGRLSAAAQDVSSLAGIIQNIFNSTGDYPTRQSPGVEGDDKFSMLFTTNPGDSIDETLGGANVKQNVTDVLTLTSEGANGGSNAPYMNRGTSDLLSYHAITNGDPKDGTPRYEVDEWSGPYMAEDKLDPWGNSYIIYVEPLQEKYRKNLRHGNVGPGATGGPYRSAWILSGGPNQVIETAITNVSVENDDIGTKVK